MDNHAIGIFDSGVGGLTVVKSVFSELPNERIIYFGDTERLPYGSKSKAVVTKFAKEITHFLLKKEVKAIIIACNTASANALEELQREFEIPIFGVIDAGVNVALDSTKNKKIGVIGTAGTVKSSAYEQKLHEKDKTCQVIQKACPLFVPLAEEGWLTDSVTYEVAKKYLSPLVAEGVDTLILGCTHYPLLKKCIGEVVGENVILVDPAKETARTVKQFLVENDMESAECGSREHEFYLSDQTEMFSELCKKALKREFAVEIVEELE
ncbi:MAG: glutamate racemase [Bacillota bacterium]